VAVNSAIVLLIISYWLLQVPLLYVLCLMSVNIR